MILARTPSDVILRARAFLREPKDLSLHGFQGRRRAGPPFDALPKWGCPTLRGFRRVGTTDLDHQVHPEQG